MISMDQQKLRRSPITMNSLVYDTSYLNKLLSNPQLRFEISSMYTTADLDSTLTSATSLTLM